LTLCFSKYQAAGNDFILLDDRSSRFSIENRSFIQKLCSRQFGIGADGLILLQTSSCADFRMRICNADGLEAAFCGNGFRCLVLYLRHLGFKEDSFNIETQNAVIGASFQGGKVLVKLPSPKVLCWGGRVEGDLGPYEFFVVDTGVPHAVIFVEDLEEFPVDKIGRQIRFHPLWATSGVNVNFIKIMPDGAIRIRTYERGVEGETLSCGTGAAAAAFVVSRKKESANTLRVIPKSGESLEFSFQDNSLDKKMHMVGPAALVFEGRLEI